MAITRKQWQSVSDKVCRRNDIHEDLDLAIHLHQAGVKIVYDRNCHVKAELRRVYSSRHELWEYLLWWPRTLKVHNKKSWAVCWIISVIPLYCATFVLIGLERLTSSAKS
jgi:hypothetical protein